MHPKKSLPPNKGNAKQPNRTLHPSYSLLAKVFAPPRRTIQKGREMWAPGLWRKVIVWIQSCHNLNKFYIREGPGISRPLADDDALRMSTSLKYPGQATITPSPAAWPFFGALAPLLSEYYIYTFAGLTFRLHTDGSPAEGAVKTCQGLSSSIPCGC